MISFFMCLLYGDFIILRLRFRVLCYEAIVSVTSFWDPVFLIPQNSFFRKKRNKRKVVF